MKKITSLLLVLLMLLSISACKSKKKEPEPSPTPEAAESTDVKDNATVKPDESESDEDDAPAASPEPEKKPAASASPAPTAKPEATEKPAPAPTPEQTPTPTPAPELSINDVITSVQYEVELPKVATTALSSDLYPSYLFIDYIDGSEALTSDALIGSIAHSLVVLKLPEGTDAAATADAIRANADPRKWICVEAEKVAVVSSGRYVMLVMSDTATVDAIVANFNYLMSQQA